MCPMKARSVVIITICPTWVSAIGHASFALSLSSTATWWIIHLSVRAAKPTPAFFGLHGVALFAAADKRPLTTERGLFPPRIHEDMRMGSHTQHCAGPPHGRRAEFGPAVEFGSCAPSFLNETIFLPLPITSASASTFSREFSVRKACRWPPAEPLDHQIAQWMRRDHDIGVVDHRD